MSEDASQRKSTATRVPLFVPLSGLSEAGDVYEVFLDVLRGHHKLYEECHYLHRDISYSNILCKQHDRATGFLVDLDLAREPHRVINVLPSDHRTTAARVFTARDMLHPFRHRIPRDYYRHDLESLFYVLLWYIHRYHDGKLVDNPPFEDWNTVSAPALHDIRACVDYSLKPTTRFAALYRLQIELKRAVDAGYAAYHSTVCDLYETRRELRIPTRNVFREPLPGRTLDGHFTFEVVESLFEQHRPSVVPATHDRCS